jgi:hypothetical protein
MRWPWVEDIVTQAGTGLLNRFGMSYKSMSAEGFLCKCGFEQTSENVVDESYGLSEDETPDQLRILA